eukprot:461166_1
MFLIYYLQNSILVIMMMIILSMIMTLKEYFGDLKVWIQENTLFFQVVTSTIVIITNQYIKCLLVVQPQMDVNMLSKHIRDDIDALNNYFGGDDDLHFCKILWDIKYKYLMAMYNAFICGQGDFKKYLMVLQQNQGYGNKLIRYIDNQRKKYMKTFFSQT